MRIYQKNFLFNLAKLKIDSHEVCVRILMLKFRWRHRLFDAGVPCSDIKPYAFIRVHDERPTLRCSLESILPAISRGIITYNDCTDGSEKIIREFCCNNPGFIPAKYEFYNIHDGESVADKWTRHANWVLSLIPRNEWLVLIDADQIYNAKKLQSAFRMAKTTKDIIILPRVELHYDGSNLFVRNRVFNFSTDHWVIFNDGNLLFVPFDDRPYELLEVLDKFQRNIKFSEITTWHFPLMKSRKKRVLEQEQLIRLDEWNKNWNGEVFDALEGTRYASELFDRNMLNREHVMKYVNQFDLRSGTGG